MLSADAEDFFLARVKEERAQGKKDYIPPDVETPSENLSSRLGKGKNWEFPNPAKSRVGISLIPVSANPEEF
jgi:hypothetical protein